MIATHAVKVVMYRKLCARWWRFYYRSQTWKTFLCFYWSFKTCFMFFIVLCFLLLKHVIQNVMDAFLLPPVSAALCCLCVLLVACFLFSFLSLVFVFLCHKIHLTWFDLIWESHFLPAVLCTFSRPIVRSLQQQSYVLVALSTRRELHSLLVVKAYPHPITKTKLTLNLTRTCMFFHVFNERLKTWFLSFFFIFAI